MAAVFAHSLTLLTLSDTCTALPTVTPTLCCRCVALSRCVRQSSSTAASRRHSSAASAHRITERPHGASVCISPVLRSAARLLRSAARLRRWTDEATVTQTGLQRGGSLLALTQRALAALQQVRSVVWHSRPVLLHPPSPLLSSLPVMSGINGAPPPAQKSMCAGLGMPALRIMGFLSGATVITLGVYSIIEDGAGIGNIVNNIYRSMRREEPACRGRTRHAASDSSAMMHRLSPLLSR